MSILVLDTNIVSFVLREDTLSGGYQAYLKGNTLAISFMTVAELYHGGIRAGWRQRRLRQPADALDGYMILHSTTEVCQWWGDVRSQRKKQPISGEDAWIAATALAYDCPLVTHNAADFRGIDGLQIVTAAEA